LIAYPFLKKNMVRYQGRERAVEIDEKDRRIFRLLGKKSFS